jgi:hypothetical protein
MILSRPLKIEPLFNQIQNKDACLKEKITQEFFNIIQESNIKTPYFQRASI